MIEVLTEVRWDVRPAPHLGTLENRICDGVSTFADLSALVALMHCLVVDLDTRLAAGEELPMMPPWHVQENKWRAARYGLDAIIILDADSNEALITDDLERLVARLEPVAERLGCSAELASVLDIPARGASYQRQRAVAAATDGDLVGGGRLGGAGAARSCVTVAPSPRSPIPSYPSLYDFTASPPAACPRSTPRHPLPTLQQWLTSRSTPARRYCSHVVGA